jgi:glycosyltransferase involved in cell wall biosynthesis
LVVAFTYAPNLDGVANAAGLVAQGLAARGHELTIATVWNPQRKPPEPSDNPKIYQFKVRGPSRWDKCPQGEESKFKEFVAGFQGDAILCHCLDTALAQLAISQFHRLPAAKVLVSHGFDAHRLNWQRKFPWGLRKWLAKQPFVLGLPWELRKFDSLVFLSSRRNFERFFDHKVAHAIGHPGIRVIPNGIDWKPSSVSMPDFRQQYKIGDRFLFLCVAYYGVGKNQISALRAYRQARIANSVLVFIGSERNEYSNTMERLDKQLAGVFPEGNVLILDKVDRRMTEAAFQAMDAFLFPSKAESQPLVLIESMAAGKPFISTDRGCIRDLAGGIIVRGESEMIREIQRLVQDANLRAELGARGRGDYLAKYQKEAVVNSYEQLILQATKNRYPKGAAR